MKTKLFAILLAIAAPMFGFAGGQEGSGGAGVHSRGVYKTFYEAGFYTDPLPSDEEVPQLKTLLTTIRGFNFLASDLKQRMLTAIRAAPDRKYYRVQKDKFDAVTAARLLETYSRLVKLPKEGLELFAVTDIPQRTTYLLPAFYELSPQGQMAILFHESYWLLYPSSTYEAVVEAEMAFQAVIDKPGDVDRIIKFLSTVSPDSKSIRNFALNHDRDVKAFDDWTSTGVPLTKFLGNDFLSCLATLTTNELPEFSYSVTSKPLKLCFSFLANHIADLQDEFPKSQLLPFYGKYVDKGTIDLFDLPSFFKRPGYEEEWISWKNNRWVLQNVDFKNVPAEIETDEGKQFSYYRKYSQIDLSQCVVLIEAPTVGFEIGLQVRCSIRNRYVGSLNTSVTKTETEFFQLNASN